MRAEAQKERVKRKLEAGSPAVNPADSGMSPVMDQPALGIEALIEELPEGLKAAAVLCIVEGASRTAAASVLGLQPGALRKRLFDARARLQRQIVERAEKELQLHPLPKDFADRCICRCQRAAQSRKEVMEMAAKKGCGCGCEGKTKPKAKASAGTKKKGK